METTITSKGQVVIPSELRRKYNLTAGTRLTVEDRNGKIVLRPVTKEYLKGLRGMLKGKKGIKVLEEERARDRDR